MDKTLQYRIDAAISDPEFGIKVTSGPTEKSVQLVNSVIQDLRDKGVDTLILGCTEIVLIKDSLESNRLDLIDPIHEMAKNLHLSI